MASFDLASDGGLKSLDAHLKEYSYISGYTASKDDLIIFTHLKKAPQQSQYPHLSRWWNHIHKRLQDSFEGFSDGKGVQVSGGASSGTAAPASASKAAPAAPSAPAPAASKAPVDDDDDDDEDDEDLDLFGEMTPEEQEAKRKHEELVAKAKARGAEKAKLTKSMIVLDVKPWDDTTEGVPLEKIFIFGEVPCISFAADMKALEAEVRAIHKDGLLWAQLVPVGFGIRKMQITAIIEDAKVESMDAIIEEELVRDGESEFIQSIDIVSFNKL